MTIKPDKHIKSLNMNGLVGRMLHYESRKKDKQEILFIYGQRSSIERWWGLIQHLHDYGSVTVPDLPGFGGMDSFYKIGKKPTLDNYADYLASFIKMKYKRRKIVIVGVSYGFVVITRMLEKYPELSKNVKMLISYVGFTGYEDFKYSRPVYYMYLYMTWLLSRRSLAWLFRYTTLHEMSLKRAYASSAHDRVENASHQQVSSHLVHQIQLWRSNDTRTYMFTTNELLLFSNCSRQVDLSVYNVIIKNDNILDYSKVEQHMKVIFNDYVPLTVQINDQAQVFLYDRKSASFLMPPKLKQLLKTLG